MITIDEAREVVAARVGLLPREPVPLREALGRVLRAEARAEADTPAFDRSAMDGYAIDGADRAARFRIVGEIRPGAAPGFAVRAGECARILTGGQIPEGASQVLKQEDVRVDGEWMAPVAPRTEQDFIRRRGEDAKAGDLLLPAGRRLGPAELSMLASMGVTQPMVSRRCRAVHFATGDELVDPAAAPGPAQIRDSNSALVRAFLESRGAHTAHQERLGDDANLLFNKAGEALEAGCDLLLISGGASVGSYDYSAPVLERLGFEIHFQKLKMRPGKPLIFATRGAQAAFGLPGNPVSHWVVLHAVVTAALDCFAGLTPTLPVITATLKRGFEVRGDGRDTLWPARVGFDAGRPVAEALRWQSSGDLTGLAGVNALIRCGAREYAAGDPVLCILFCDV